MVCVVINDSYAFSKIYFSCFEFLLHWGVSTDISYLLFTRVHLKKITPQQTHLKMNFKVLSYSLDHLCQFWILFYLVICLLNIDPFIFLISSVYHYSEHDRCYAIGCIFPER